MAIDDGSPIIGQNNSIDRIEAADDSHVYQASGVRPIRALRDCLEGIKKPRHDAHILNATSNKQIYEQIACERAGRAGYVHCSSTNGDHAKSPREIGRAPKKIKGARP